MLVSSGSLYQYPSDRALLSEKDVMVQGETEWCSSSQPVWTASIPLHF